MEAVVAPRMVVEAAEAAIIDSSVAHGENCTRTPAS
jgi:hypothetical protein